MTTMILSFVEPLHELHVHAVLRHTDRLKSYKLLVHRIHFSNSPFVSSPFVSLRKEFSHLSKSVISEVLSSTRGSLQAPVSSATSAAAITPDPVLTPRETSSQPVLRASQSYPVPPVCQTSQSQPVSELFPCNGVWYDIRKYEAIPSLCAVVNQIPDIVRSSKSKNTNKKYDQYFARFEKWSQSIKQSVTEGNDVFVFCDGKRTPGPGYSVFWTNSYLQYHQDGSSLTINQITRNYAEDYECFEIDHSTNATNKIFGASVDVTYPAKILSSNYQSALVENETFSLEVAVEGNPLPDIKMVQIGTNAVAYQSANEGSFNISFVAHCSNTDSYLLTCSNELNYDHLVLDLTVLCAPRPDPGKSITYVHKPRVGEYVQLEMFDIGYPAPSFTWYHGDKAIAHVDTNHASVVDIHGIKVEDFGNYSLSMSNSVGQNTYQYWIEADGPPDSATDLQVGPITTDTATLSWLPGFDYGNLQTFTIVLLQNGEQHELDQVTLEGHRMDRVSHTETNLNAGTTYNMKVKSSNSKGEAASLSNEVTFKTDSPTPPGPSEASQLYSSVLPILLMSVIVRLFEI